MTKVSNKDLTKKPNITKLKEAIDVAEKVLIDIEEDDTRKAKRKRKRVTKALESAYELLNREAYTQKDVDKRTDDIWVALMDDDNYLGFIMLSFSFLLSGAIIFTVFQAFSFIQTNWNPDHHHHGPELNEELSELITVNYVEENIVSLYDQMTVSDQVGLQNPPQEFTIENNSNKVGSLKYLVHYSVNIVPMNDPSAKLIDKKYIKYKYTYKDSATGKYYESKIGTLADLKKNEDGSLMLTKGRQRQDSKTDYKVVFWISSLAGNDQQNRSYTFAFKVNGAIAKS